jgi:pimeloyl-ACP methyl ester carboxylesterase
MSAAPVDTREGRSSKSEPVVLVLPGMTLNGTIMPPLAAESFSVDFCQFIPDAPDHRVTMDLYVDRLRTALAQQPLWQRRRRVVVAHSFGGMLALRWLLEEVHRPEPDLPDGLVLVSTTAGPMYDVLRLRVARVGGRAVRLGMRRIMPIWNLRLVTRAVKAVLSPGRECEGRVDFQSLKRPTDFTVDLAGWRNTDWRAMRGFRLAMRGFDVRDRLHALRIPTAVLHGTDDPLFPQELGANLARRLPRGRLRLVEGAGHALPLTHGDAVVEAVEEMFGRIQETEDRSQASGVRSETAGSASARADGDRPPPPSAS